MLVFGGVSPIKIGDCSLPLGMDMCNQNQGTACISIRNKTKSVKHFLAVFFRWDEMLVARAELHGDVQPRHEP